MAAVILNMPDNEIHKQILELRTQLTQFEIQHWRTDSFLLWGWWFKLAVFTFPWYIWWLAVDRRRLMQVFSYAMVLALLNCLTDIALVNLRLYSYPHRLQPIWEGMVGGDITIPSVISSLIYQYCPGWGRFLAATTAAAAGFAFVGEPILIKAGLYELYNWSIWYSFPAYIVLAVIPKLLIDFLQKRAAPNA